MSSKRLVAKTNRASWTRLNSPSDDKFRVTTASAKQIAANYNRFQFSKRNENLSNDVKRLSIAKDPLREHSDFRGLLLADN